MMMSARWAQPRLRPLVIALAVLALVGVGARSAQAGDGAQFSGDCGSGVTYVNKKVGANEQWAISWDGFQIASGNVFKLDGGAPSFIECFVDNGNVDSTSITFDVCYGSAACSAPPCGGAQWSQIATNLTISTSFFYPPGVDLEDPESSCEDNTQEF